jgi:hypothetical protein
MTPNDCVRSGFSGNRKKIKTKMFGHNRTKRFRACDRGFHSLTIAAAYGQPVVENHGTPIRRGTRERLRSRHPRIESRYCGVVRVGRVTFPEHAQHIVKLGRPVEPASRSALIFRPILWLKPQDVAAPSESDAERSRTFSIS